MHIKKIKNGLRYEKDGWIYISIKGKPYERGYAYGKLMLEDMKYVKKILDFVIYNDFGVKWDFFIENCNKYYKSKIEENFIEFYEEMKGFADGSNMTLDEVIAWNNYFTLTESWWSNMPEEISKTLRGETKSVSSSREGGGNQERCSAFIAVGNWTKDGSIICGHNNFSNYIDGQLAKYVININPESGNNILMMGFPGWIWSGTDFFTTSAGIIGTETTIGGFSAYENKFPISCRIRQAMQYGNNLDDYERILKHENSGDYANSWLFGDINTNEIMRIELGLKYVNVERTKNGYYIGFNATYDPRIRNLECVNSGFDDIRRHQGSRRVRLDELMNKHKGELNEKLAMEILGDHYDVYLKKDNPCSRTICAHYDLDAREYMSDQSRPKPFQPRGALDGNVISSSSAKKMSFYLKWGNSCSLSFDKNKFCDEHMEWNYLRPYLEDRPLENWSLFCATKYKKSKTKKYKKLQQKKMKTKRNN